MNESTSNNLSYLHDFNISFGAKGALSALVFLKTQSNFIVAEELYHFIGGDDDEGTAEEYLQELVDAGYVKVEPTTIEGWGVCRCVEIGDFSEAE